MKVPVIPSTAKFDRVERLMARYTAAKSRADLWISLLQNCYQYSIPERNLFNNRTEGSDKGWFVYDTTAVAAVVAFTSKMQAFLTPPFTKWAMLAAGQDIPVEKRDEIDKLLEVANDVLFKYIWRSNFDLTSNESYFDLAIGTGALQCNEGDSDDNPLVFSAASLEQIALEEGPNGTVETVWRTHTDIPLRIVQRLWPEAVLPRVLEDALAQKPDEKVKLAEGTVYQAETKTYDYVVIELTTREIIFETTDKSSPWIIYRWSKTANEVLGRGPVVSALPTIKTLNKVCEFELKSAAMAVSPPYMAYNDGVFNVNNIKIQPNTIISVARGVAGQWPIAPLPTNPNYQFAQVLATDLRQQINTLLFADPLGPIDSPSKTATEITYRQMALSQLIGPAFGRLQVELLSKLIDRCVFILKKRGLFPDIRIDGKEVQLKYVSPLAKAQNQAEVAGLSEYFGLLQQFVGPELATLSVHETRLPKWLAEKKGVDLTLIKTESELNELKKKIAEQQAQQQAAEAAQAAQNQPNMDVTQ